MGGVEFMSTETLELIRFSAGVVFIETGIMLILINFTDVFG